jgi:hypothetical protein
LRTRSVAINVRLYPWLSLQSEVLFASKGAEAEMEGLLLSTFEARYVQVPLLVRASRSLGESVSVYGFTGPTWDFLLSYRAQALDGSVLDLTDRARQMDLGLLGGAGLELVVSAGQSLTFEGRYSYSLQTISRDESEDFRNRVFAVMLGYQFSFSSRMMQEPPMLSGKNGSYGLGLE